MPLHRKSGEVITIVILALVCLAGGGAGMSYLDGAKVARAKQAALTAQAQAAAAAREIAAVQASQAADREAIAATERLVAQLQANQQAAANANAKGTAVFAAAPAQGRKDTVLANTIATTASILPPPTNFADILAQVRQELDEAKTTNAVLQRQHEDDLSAASAVRSKADTLAAELERERSERATAARAATVASEETRLAKAEAEKANGLAARIGAQLHTVWRWLLVAAGVYAAVHWLIPSLAQEFPQSRVLALLWKWTKSVASAH